MQCTLRQRCEENVIVAQAPATQDITPNVDFSSHNFALGPPQKASVDDEWDDLSPAPAVYGSNPAAAYSPSLCRQPDYSGLSQDEYARSLSPLDRRSRSCSRGRSGSEQHPSYTCPSLSPAPARVCIGMPIPDSSPISARSRFCSKPEHAFTDGNN